MDEDGLLTALPGSMDPETGRWRVTAFVTPRLDPGGDQVELAEFPGFADWGEISGQLRLGLEFDSPGFVGTLDLEPDPSSPRPDPALWRTLFADVRVGSGKFQDLSGNTVASFPAAAVAQLVRSTYAAVAESSPTKLPPVTSGPLAVLHQLGEEMARDRDREGSDHPMAQLPSSSPPPGSPAGTPGRYVDRDLVGSPTSDPGIGLTIHEALRFYDRPGAADPLGPDVEPPPPDRPALDFHAFVSALADYPELLRRLGLALDFLIVDGEQLPAGPGRVRFDPFDVPVEWPRRAEARPWTQYEIVDRRFIARPLEGEEELVDGSLRVESSRLFLLEQIDIDGAALKVANTARTIVATRKVVLDSPGSETVAPSMTPDESSLPALRGSGLTLYRDRRARKIVNGWDNAKGQDDQHTAGAELDLFAEDVTRGYRLDVAELAEPDTWFSLQARVGAYALRTAVPGERLALPVAEPIRPDEGYVKAASASHNAAEPDVAYIHEAIAGWEGWSLAAPRPGNRIGQHRVEPPEDPAAEPPGFALPLEVTFRPQSGSLPRLRFGRSYRMRARLVDMAGRSVPPDFLDPNHVTPFTTFFRWDPVPAPVVVPRRPFTEGESLLRMVIRSTLDVTAAAYPDLPRITSLGRAHPGRSGVPGGQRAASGRADRLAATGRAARSLRYRRTRLLQRRRTRRPVRHRRALGRHLALPRRRRDDHRRQGPAASGGIADRGRAGGAARQSAGLGRVRAARRRPARPALPAGPAGQRRVLHHVAGRRGHPGARLADRRPVVRPPAGVAADRGGFGPAAVGARRAAAPGLPAPGRARRAFSSARCCRARS